MNKAPLTFTPKTKNQHFEHFVFRLKERYGLEVSEVEYDELPNEYVGVANRGMNSIGFVMIQGVKVWVRKLNNRFGNSGCMLTCYPPNIEHDIDSFIMFFFRKSHRQLAIILYNQYLEEDAELSLMFFESDKDFFIYVRNYLVFYKLHGLKRSGKLNWFRLFAEIDKVINCEHKSIIIKAEKRP